MQSSLLRTHSASITGKTPAQITSRPFIQHRGYATTSRKVLASSPSHLIQTSKFSGRTTTLVPSGLQNLRASCFSTNPNENANIRNIAIIAHVDHGKTTMVDEMLKQSGTITASENERVMDSNQLEKERGITILSKITGFNWKGIKVNLVDTPGHGDFGGEVERVLSMVEGVILLVDATEGVMAQTKFVLSKALASGLRPIVVLNKMDRKEILRVTEVEGEIFDLFMALEATEQQMSYPTLYAAGRAGWCIANRGDPQKNMEPLFDAILTHVPPPKVVPGAPFSMLVTTLESDPYLGKIVVGKVRSGSVKMSDPIHALSLAGQITDVGKVNKISSRKGLEKVFLEEAHAGDIIGIAGLEKATVTSTIASPTVTQPIKANPIDPPVLSVRMFVNNSPLSGKEGSHSTFPTIKKRLDKEVETNVSIAVAQAESGEALQVSGRGELQLGVLIENMRREGFEISVSPPEVVFKEENGKKLEPVEEVTIDVDHEYSSAILDKMTNRKAEFVDMKQIAGKTRLQYLCPSRILVGLRNELLTQTRGTAVFNHLFHSYAPYQAGLSVSRRGSLISMATGVCTSYSLGMLEARGTLFVEPQTKVYPGMVIGEHSRETDLEVNPTKAKALSNMRTTSKEEQVRLSPIRQFSLEEAIAYVRGDQLLEITPQSIRIRMAPKKVK